MFANRLSLTLVCVLSAAIATGCNSPAEPTSVAVSSLEESVEATSDVRTETTYVIRDAETLRRVWQQLFNGRRELPAVDFAREMVVAVTLGERPTAGYVVRITGVTRSDRGLVVQVTAAAPAPGCSTAAVITYPVAVARLRSFDGPVRFEFTRTTRPCDGR